MSYNQPLQDFFLKEISQTQMPVSIFLVNGIKLHGVIASFDEHVIMLKNSITQMVYKHAISTVVPSRAMNIPTGESNNNMAD